MVDRMGSVLVVDDERSMREFLAICLRREGHRVEVAESGEDALAKLLAQPTDIVVTRSGPLYTSIVGVSKPRFVDEVGEWWRYLGAMLGGGAVNYAAYSAVIGFGPANPLLPLAAVMCGSLAGMTVNFISAKFFVFKI